jgi:transposase
MLSQNGFVTEARMAICARRHWTSYFKWLQKGRWSWVAIGLQTARLALRYNNDKLCTDLSLSGKDVILAYNRRWPIEDLFNQLKNL